jgi:hypothetical protein
METSFQKISNLKNLKHKPEIDNEGEDEDSGRRQSSTVGL